MEHLENWKKIDSENFKHQYWLCNYEHLSWTEKNDYNVNDNKMIKKLLSNLAKGSIKCGYKKFSIIFNNNKSKAIRAHRLIYQEYNKEKITECYSCKNEPSIFNMFESKHDIDHINAIKSDNTPSNLQRLCKSCHSKKTRNENKHVSGRRTKKIIATKKDDDLFLEEFINADEIKEKLGLNLSSINKNIQYNMNNSDKKFIGKRNSNEKFSFTFEKFIDNKDEIWKDIPNSSKKLNQYKSSPPMQISNYGRIRDHNKCILEINETHEDYMRIKINGVIYAIHVLVMKAFKYDELIKKVEEQKKTYVECKNMTNDEIIDSYNKKYSIHVDHIDRNRKNNHLENLRWTSIKENNSNKKTVKEIEQWSLDGKNLITTFKNQTEAANSIGINPSCISMVCNGKRLDAGGYIWKFKKL